MGYYNTITKNIYGPTTQYRSGFYCISDNTWAFTFSDNLRNDTKKDLAAYLHVACFSPLHSTLIKSVNNNQFWLM